jgi:hypothetical protein
VRPSSLWLAAAAAFTTFACYAELPGSSDHAFDSGAFVVPGGLDAGSTGGSEDGGGGFPGGGSLDAGGGDTGSGAGGGGQQGGGEGGSAEAGVDGGLGPCDGVAQGAIQQRVRHAEAQVVAPTTCQSETQMRTCGETGFSAWTGTYQAESCEPAAVRSCGATPHGGTEARQRYPFDFTDDHRDCVAETQTRACDDGSFGEWSGEAEHDRCVVTFLGDCGAAGVFSGSSLCETGTSCAFAGLQPRCLGSGGHSCSSNNECVNFCVGGACTGASIARGGSCDDTTDCSKTSCPSASGGNATTASCVANACVCAAGSGCTANNQCAGTCVAQSIFQSACVVANTSCDNIDDCRGDAKCIKSGSASTGTCLVPDGKPCGPDIKCEHVCRASGKCGAAGKPNETCAQNSECAAPLVCRAATAGASACQMPGQLSETCDAADGVADCVSGYTCTQQGVCMLAAGQQCVVSTGALSCASGVCTPCTDSSNATCPTLGTCQ